MVLMGMELPLTAIRQQIAAGLDIIIHLGRLRDRSRRVLEITEVVGFENSEIRLNPLFVFCETGEDEDGRIVGNLQRKGELICESKLKAAGLA
jgi:pilus assembly protein CpaF